MHMLRHRCLVWDLVLVILDHVVGSTPVSKKKKKVEQLDQFEYSDNTNNISKTIGRICELLRVCTDLLLRKQFWMTLMMKEAASFSLKPGLNRCLEMRGETANDVQNTYPL